MTQAARPQLRLPRFEQLRHRPARTLVAQRRKRRKGLKLCCRSQPLAYTRPRFRPPLLKRHRQLFVPENQRPNNAHQRVIARVKPVEQSPEPCNAIGCRPARCFKRASQLPKQRRTERFALETRHQRRENTQVAPRAFHAFQYTMRSLAKRVDNREVADQNHRQRPQRNRTREYRNHGCNSQQREQQHKRPQPAGKAHNRRRTPGRQRFYPHLRRHILRQQRYVLAQVHVWTKLLDRALPPPRLFHHGRLQQPARQRILACPRARCGDQLKESAFAENVKIFRIHMRRIAKPFARIAAPDPFIFQSRQRSFVIRRRTRGPCTRPQHTLMPDHQHRECCNRRQQPPHCHALPRENKPCQHHKHSRNRQPQIADLIELLLQNLGLRAKACQPCTILLECCDL